MIRVGIYGVVISSMKLRSYLNEDARIGGAGCWGMKRWFGDLDEIVSERVRVLGFHVRLWVVLKVGYGEVRP